MFNGKTYPVLQSLVKASQHPFGGKEKADFEMIMERSFFASCSMMFAPGLFLPLKLQVRKSIAQKRINVNDEQGLIDWEASMISIGRSGGPGGIVNAIITVDQTFLMG